MEAYRLEAPDQLCWRNGDLALIHVEIRNDPKCCA